MKVIRFGQACDVEVDMVAGDFSGIRLRITWRDKVDNTIEAVEVDDHAGAFRVLYDLYINNKNVRIPAKSVIEFAMMAVAGLTQYTPPRNTEWTQTTGTAR